MTDKRSLRFQIIKEIRENSQQQFKDLRKLTLQQLTDILENLNIIVDFQLPTFEEQPKEDKRKIRFSKIKEIRELIPQYTYKELIKKTLDELDDILNDIKNMEEEETINEEEIISNLLEWKNSQQNILINDEQGFKIINNKKQPNIEGYTVDISKYNLDEETKTNFYIELIKRYYEFNFNNDFILKIILRDNPDTEQNTSVIYENDRVFTLSTRFIEELTNRNLTLDEIITGEEVINTSIEETYNYILQF
jgi:hypothetical protein